jgi:NhaP-type Na+/H+ or K+/H+ antiporter
MMISPSSLFLLFSGIVFLGYVLKTLFYRIKIIVTLPLMIIGLLLGPVFHFISSSSGSLVVSIASYVSAIAIAFILFDAGLSIKLYNAGLLKSAKFTFSLATATGLLLSVVIYLMTGWGLIYCFIAGFALSGPSSAIVPTLTKSLRIGEGLKSAMIFESVATDILELIVPLALIEVITIPGFTIASVPAMLFEFVVMSAILGLVSAFFWAFMLKSFREYSEEYSWMLTITMVIATYGTAQLLGFNGAITVFVFGIVFANLSYMSKRMEKFSYDLKPIFKHVQEYQGEITFFVSTFFFVYVGLLFTLSSGSIYLDLALGVIGVGISLIILLARDIFTPLLNGIFQDKKPFGSERTLVVFDVARGLSPIIIAILVASDSSLGAPIGFLNFIFIVVILTNVVQTVGMFFYARKANAEAMLARTIAMKAHEKNRNA